MKYFLMMVTIGLIGCGNKVDESFKAQLMQVIQTGTKVNASTSSGTSIDDYQKATAEFYASLELALVMWPEGFCPEGKKELLDAKKCWEYGSKLWDWKFESKRIFGWDELGLNTDRYEGDQRSKHESLDQYPKALRDAVVIKTGGQNENISYVAWDQIPVVLAVASKLFEQSRQKIMADLK